MESYGFMGCVVHDAGLSGSQGAQHHRVQTRDLLRSIQETYWERGCLWVPNPGDSGLRG